MVSMEWDTLISLSAASCQPLQSACLFPIPFPLKIQRDKQAWPRSPLISLEIQLSYPPSPANSCCLSTTLAMYQNDKVPRHSILSENIHIIHHCKHIYSTLHFPPFLGQGGRNLERRGGGETKSVGYFQFAGFFPQGFPSLAITSDTYSTATIILLWDGATIMKIKELELCRHRY